MPSFFSKLRRKSGSHSKSKTDLTSTSAQDVSNKRLSSTVNPNFTSPRNDDARPFTDARADTAQRTRSSVDDIPPRTSSLHDSPRKDIASDMNRMSMKDAPQLPPLQLDKQTPETPIDDRDSVPLSSTQLEQQNRQTAVQDREHAPQPTELRQPTDLARHSDAPQLPPLQLNSDPIATSITPSVALPATATVFSKGLVPINDPSLPAPPSLEDQRNVLVDEVASEAKARKTEPLGDEAKAVFKAAGMEVERGSLEVETRYLKPVVQEHIIIKEHTETTTVIDQHIHRHHVYPKIQPLSDPNPILLEPRHRIFSAIDGKWHEVIGDAAAIAILGEDVFYNGKKEVRETREPASEEEVYRRRVVEREGVQGELSSWRQMIGQKQENVETPGKMIGEGWMLPEDQMGPATKTVGIAL